MPNQYFTHDTKLVPGTKARSADVNNRFDAVEGGFDKFPDPAPGGFADPIVVGEASSEDHAVTAGQVRDGDLTYTVDTGTANTMVAALPQPPPAYTAGMTITVKVAATNTGATTLDLNSLGSRPVKRISGEQLYAGDLVAGRVVGLRYDGTSFILLDGTYAIHNHDDLYTRATTVSAHMGSKSNPHAVTKAQVGLGNVANVDTTNAGNITTGFLDEDRIPTTIARVALVIDHTGRADNPHGVTKAQVGLGNVANVNTTNASNITSGTLADARIPSTITRDSELNTHTSRTDNPHGVTKAQVGLGNVDNTSDADKPVSTATQTALDQSSAATQTALNLKANLASPSFTGNPLVPTQAYALGAADSSVKAASTAYVNNRIAELTKLLRGSTWLQMFPSGLLLQVGLSLASSTAGGEVTVTFAQPYTGSAPFVLVSGITNNTATNSCWVTATDIMFFKFRASLASQNITWLAFGYSSIGDDV